MSSTLVPHSNDVNWTQGPDHLSVCRLGMCKSSGLPQVVPTINVYLF